MHTVQHRYDRNDIMLGDCSTCGHDYCNGLSIPDFNLGWKVSAVQGIGKRALNTEKSGKPKTTLLIRPWYPSSCVSPLPEALAEVSLPLSLEIVATDTSLYYDNECAFEKLGVVDGRIENVSCSELGDL